MTDAFAGIDLVTIVGDDDDDLGYTSISTALFRAAADAESKSDDIQNKIFSLLYEACQARLYIENPHNPFRVSFTESEIGFFALISKRVNNHLIRARLSDLVWNSRNHRKIEFALLAIDSYTSVSLDSKTWYGGGENCWRRAISLSRLIGKGAGDRLDRIESNILNVLKNTTADNGFFGHSLANALLEFDLGRNNQIAVAEKLKLLADEFDLLENFRTSGRYYAASFRWFAKSESEERAVDMRVAEAESFEKEAESRLNSDDPSHLVAVGFLKSAVQTYIEIPNSLRSRHDVDQKIRELTLRIGEFGKLSLDEMASYKSPTIDLTESVEHSRQSVSGKPIFEALVLFTNLHHTNFDELRELAQKSLSSSIVHKLFPTMFISHDGRVTGTKSPMTGSESSEEYEEIIRSDMNHFYFGPAVSVAVYGAILPALNTLNIEHNFTESDLSDLARRSPAVPRGRESMWGKALFQGFNHDFATSVHLLVPQIEHLVRFHLKANDVVTTFVDHRAGGRETENGLSALMKLPETETVFGKDMSYEIGALFCEYSGPNLRNDIAHGLLDDQQVFSVYSVYAWWFGLKLVVRSLLPPLKPDDT